MGQATDKDFKQQTAQNQSCSQKDCQMRRSRHQLQSHLLWGAVSLAWQGMEQTECLTAARTMKNGGERSRRIFSLPNREGVRDRQQRAQVRQAPSMGSTKETVVAHFDKALGQHVLQKAMDKGVHGEGAKAWGAGVGGPIAKSDFAVGQR